MRRSWCSRSWLVALALPLVLAACVPEPAYRANLTAGAPQGDGAPETSEPTPAGPTPTPSFVRPTPTPGPSFATYKVKKGDTLSKIAKKLKTSAKSLSYWNRVTYPSLDPDSAKYRPDRLELGWILVYLKGQEVDPEDLPTLSPEPTPTPEAAAPERTLRA